jgi:hypothetical protein
MSSDNIEQFIELLRKSLADGEFIRLVLGNYKGTDAHLQKIIVREIETRKGRLLQFTYRMDTRDVVQNFTRDDAPAAVRGSISSGFRSGNLFTTQNDIQLTVGKRNSRLVTQKPTAAKKASLAHDREKNYLVDPSAFYLKELGITTAAGEIRASARGKWKQINKFVEILGDLVERSELKDARELRVVDMGSGKGYLTFAAYEHFRGAMQKRFGDEFALNVTGIEARRDLVDICNGVAKNGGYKDLSFTVGTIAESSVDDADIVIALHACDTATDDALYKGIAAKAKIIIASPCCHKELRPQISPPDELKGVLKHGTLLERAAETLTDGIRALLLESSGYSTKVFEFVPSEHTPKNNMIAAVRSNRPSKDAAEQIAAIKKTYGIKNQRLETLLGG